MTSTRIWLMALCVCTAGVYCHAAVVWQHVTGTKTIALSNSEDSSAANPNSSAAQGFNLCCDDGTTIALTKKDVSGVTLYRFFSAVIATNGTAPTVTLDVTALAGAPLRLHNHFHFKSDATLVIRGTNVVEFGANANWATYFPTFNVPHQVLFQDAAGTAVAGKVRFVDRVCVYPLPGDLTWEIGEGATVAPRGNALGFGNAITLTNYDLMLAETTGGTGENWSVPCGATITVPEGRILYFFPTKVNGNFRWDRPGGTVYNNVVLAGGKLGLGVAGSSSRLEGTLTGHGTVIGTWTASEWNRNVFANIYGPVCFTGAVDFAVQTDTYYASSDTTRGAQVIFNQVCPGTRITSLTMGKTNSTDKVTGFNIRRDPTVSDAAFAATPLRIDTIVTQSSSSYGDYLSADLPVTVGSVTGTLDVRGTGPVTLETQGASQVIRHTDQLVPPAGTTTYPGRDGYCFTYGSGFADVVNENLRLDPVTGRTFRVRGASQLVAGNPKWELRVPAGETLDLVPTTNRMAVAVEGGTVRLRGAAWQDWATLWLDASAETSVSNLTVTYANSYAGYGNTEAVRLAPGTVFYTNGYPLVAGWFDRRATGSHKLWSDRYDNLYNGNHNVMPGTHPIRVLGGLNGKDYISFCANSGRKANITHARADGTSLTFGGDDSFNENSRAYFYPRTCTDWGKYYNYTYPKYRYAFLVFGSQNGGGSNLLGTGGAAFRRSAATLAAGLTANADAITQGKGWVDGVHVALDQANVLNGGWQVVTIDAGSVNWQSSGFGEPGGANYAEVIFINRNLTDEQRVEIEIYLAEKWGLSAQYHYPAGAQTNATATASLYGTNGTVRVDVDDIALTGAFAGTIDLNGRSVSVEGTLPPDDTVVDTTDCTGWFDPERTDLLVEGELGSRKPTTRITRLYDRCGKDDGRFCLAERVRAPWRNASARRFGGVRNWMDYCNFDPVSNANNGNLFQFRPMKNGDGVAGMWTNHCRTIILAQDSKYGGGQPFVDGNSVLPSRDQKYAKRVGKKAHEPIYPAGSDGLLTQGHTYLDGVEVDGTTHGFLGRAEILSVIPTNRYGFLCFEHLENSEHLGTNACTSAIHGEILMWDRVLADAERQRVEAYLAWKWLGVTAAGYSALTNATVTGAGRLQAASFAVLPKFAAACSATVEVAASELVFTAKDGAIFDARTFGGATLALPAACTVTIRGEKLEPGTYRLVSCGGGLEATAFALATEKVGGRRYALVRSASALDLRVIPSGTMVFVR